MQLLSLKNRFRARFPSKHHRQLLHQDHLQSICSAGTILELQIKKKFHRLFIHQHHLQSHLFCGNDPTVTNNNEILSTAKTRNTGGTPFTMRNRSERGPTTDETVSQLSHRKRWIIEVRGRTLCGKTPHTRPSRTRRTAEVDHGLLGRALSGKVHGFMQLLSLKNTFRA